MLQATVNAYSWVLYWSPGSPLRWNFCGPEDKLCRPFPKVKIQQQQNFNACCASILDPYSGALWIWIRICNVFESTTLVLTLVNFVNVVGDYEISL